MSPFGGRLRGRLDNSPFGTPLKDGNLEMHKLPTAMNEKTINNLL